MKAIEKIREMKQAYDNEVKTFGKKALKEAFSEYFDANPKVLGIGWTQYTPYFNDGDACTFRLGESYALVDSNSEEAQDSYEEFTETIDGVKCVDARSCFPAPKYDPTPMAIALGKFWHNVAENDVFLAVFGDHTRVVATRKGFEVEEYDHE